MKTFKNYTSYRLVWMGFAALWIILYHTAFDFKSPILCLIRDSGYGGVDILTFSAGLGYYHSLRSENNYSIFLKKRILRIYPTYIICIIIWAIFRFKAGIPVPIRAFIGNAFFVQLFTGTGNYYNWYFSLYLIQLLITPLFFSIVSKSSYKKSFFYLTILLIATIPFWSRNVITVRLICRIPIFYLGMILEKLIEETDCSQKKINIIKLISILFFLLGTYLLYLVFKKFSGTDYPLSFGFLYYPFILITPGLCLILSLLSIAFKKNSVGRLIVDIGEWFGEMSLELFVAHTLIYQILFDWLDSNEKYAIGIILSIIFSWIIKRTSETIQKHII